MSHNSSEDPISEQPVSGLAYDSEQETERESDTKYVDTDASGVIVADAAERLDRNTQLSFPIVGIGGSAGGLEAYIELFEHLPENTGMAFVVISHLPPDQRSHLPEIIARHTKMPAVSIQNGMRPEPNNIYLIPSNVQVSLQEGAFLLETRSADGPFRPIDVFFRSLAVAQKNLAIGIVLSGMDADGSLGLKSIKAEGGIIIVQAPESARFPEMPRSSLSADHVDMVLSPDQIGFQLPQLAQKSRTVTFQRLERGQPAPDEDKHLARILRQLKGVSGVDFRLYKPSTIRRRIARRMLMHRMDTLADYAILLQGDSKELRDLQEDILINVTQFFRDPDVFEALKHVVFRRILEDRPPEQQIRFWVPGCSSGEEVYTLAMALLEFLTGVPVEPQIQIFGTDASEPSIQKARAGFFPESIRHEVSPERLRRFFIKTEKGFQIAKRIRDMCIFARQNLCNDPPFSRLDLVSCRNVLIYFDSELQKQVVPTFNYALRPEGFLLLGSAESIRNYTDLFALVDRKHKIYAKVSGSATSTLREIAPRVFLDHRDLDAQNLAPITQWNDTELQRAADRIVLSRYGPPGIIVNEHLEILQSRGRTSQFLELAQGAASLQLNRMLRESIASQVIAAVRSCIQRDLPLQVDSLKLQDGDEADQFTLEVLPVHGMAGRPRCYLLLFISNQSLLNAAPLPVRPIAGPETSEEDLDRLVAQLQQDLSSSRVYLQSLLEERDAKNQELVSANEEIQSANEELQSTNEELETTKEELQSSNEELQTVNDELQNRNAVLSQATNDLQNLLNSVNLPVLMLSNNFNIRHFTPQMQRLMSLRNTDIGRPFADIRINLNIENLEHIFADVLETLTPREMEVQDREGYWYLLRVRPYRTAENRIEGVVVALVDIDQLRRSQKDLLEARDFARSIIDNIPVPLVVIDSDFRIRVSNEAFHLLAGSSGNSLERRSLLDLALVLWGLDQPLPSLLTRLHANSHEQTSFEFEHKTTHEIPKVFLIRGRALLPDGQQFLLLTFEDITSHKEVERLLEAESRQLACAVETTTKELERSREDLRALAGDLLSRQEQERRRLARELHDDVSQRLAAVNMLGEEALAAIASDQQTARQKLQQGLSQIGQLSDDIRTLSHRLHPSILEHLGLATALHSLIEEFGEREEMIITFSAGNVPENLPLEIATAFYRIVQEALRNVAKHAGKTHVKVTLARNASAIVLQVQDFGKGFNPEQQPAGLGLISMRERARLIGAAIRISSRIGEGTSLTLEVPLPPGS